MATGPDQARFDDVFCVSNESAFGVSWKIAFDKALGRKSLPEISMPPKMTARDAQPRENG
jgi:hypothetical protein